MARKDLLKSLMTTREETGAGDPPSPARDAGKPRYTKGAIGAVSKSIAELKTRSVLDLDPFEIEAGGVQDRLEHDETDHAALMHSLKEHGQQVPILVRPHPEKSDRYQIVYGRRRVLALRDLGMPVKAMVRDLDDQALVVAQGQENTARRDLSFIERANFARQMTEAGYERKIICDALSIDKTVISRMLSITEKIPLEVIETIGSAPGIGRDRWLSLAETWQAADADTDTALSMIHVSQATSSDGRFDAVQNWLAGRPREHRTVMPKTESTELRRSDGRLLGRVQRGRSSVTITIKSAAAEGFEDWLADNIEEIHRNWQSQGGE